MLNKITKFFLLLFIIGIINSSNNQIDILSDNEKLKILGAGYYFLENINCYNNYSIIVPNSNEGKNTLTRTIKRFLAKFMIRIGGYKVDNILDVFNEKYHMTLESFIYGVQKNIESIKEELINYNCYNNNIKESTRPILITEYSNETIASHNNSISDTIAIPLDDSNEFATPNNSISESQYTLSEDFNLYTHINQFIKKINTIINNVLDHILFSLKEIKTLNEENALIIRNKKEKISNSIRNNFKTSGILKFILNSTNHKLLTPEELISRDKKNILININNYYNRLMKVTFYKILETPIKQYKETWTTINPEYLSIIKNINSNLLYE